MASKKEIKKTLDQSLKEFSQLSSTRKAKEEIYYAMMQEVAPTSTTTFLEAEEQVAILAAENHPTPPKQKRRFSFPRPVFAGATGFLAAALLIVVIRKAPSVGKPKTIFNPPLAPSDITEEIAAIDTPYRTVATNNHFYLGYEETEARVGTLDLYVHSRSGEVDWDSIVVSSDKGEIQPLSVSPESSTISLPVDESELEFQIEDQEGNLIYAVLPTDI